MIVQCARVHNEHFTSTICVSCRWSFRCARCTATAKQNNTHSFSCGGDGIFAWHLNAFKLSNMLESLVSSQALLRCLVLHLTLPHSPRTKSQPKQAHHYMTCQTKNKYLICKGRRKNLKVTHTQNNEKKYTFVVEIIKWIRALKMWWTKMRFPQLTKGALCSAHSFILAPTCCSCRFSKPKPVTATKDSCELCCTTAACIGYGMCVEPFAVCCLVTAIASLRQ